MASMLLWGSFIRVPRALSISTLELNRSLNVKQSLLGSLQILPNSLIKRILCMECYRNACLGHIAREAAGSRCHALEGRLIFANLGSRLKIVNYVSQAMFAMNKA